MASSLLLVMILSLVVPFVAAHQIEHVVVMMLENRAFDHLLGYYGKLNDTRVDGLTGKECNPISLTDKTAGKVCVNDQAKDNCAYDPNHSFLATTERIFACEWNKTRNTPCTNTKMNNGLASMNGFTSSAVREGKSGTNELTMWPPQKVPIITTLAKEFALFDRFFAAHPGNHATLSWNRHTPYTYDAIDLFDLTFIPEFGYCQRRFVIEGSTFPLVAS